MPVQIYIVRDAVKIYRFKPIKFVQKCFFKKRCPEPLVSSCTAPRW